MRGQQERQATMLLGLRYRVHSDGWKRPVGHLKVRNWYADAMSDGDL